jgi:23S rRNA pseudouridine1911/1915/1917 synthase
VRYPVWPQHDGERLDRGVAAMTGLPRRRVRALAESGSLWLNGRPARVLSHPLRSGDAVDVIVAPPPPTPPAALPPEILILHEDAWILAVDKPPGIASQAPRQRSPGELTMGERLALQLARRDGRRGDLVLFHRLDRITSGVMLFVRRHEAARALAAAWVGREVEKIYLAVVHGDPGGDPVTLSGAIVRGEPGSPRRRVAARGRPASTVVRRLACGSGLTLVEARPLTGRTHQVRAHLATAGLPLAGDRLYGGGGGVPRPFLHAWRLTLPHPRDAKPLPLQTPIPSDMSAFLVDLGIDPSAFV